MSRIAVDRTSERTGVVALAGEHETYTVPKLEAELFALLDEARDVVVDLRATTFIDSSIVSVLLQARDHAHELGVRFELLLGDSTGWPVRRLLEITGLDAAIPIADGSTALPRS